MKIVFIGLTISSSWGNGHATTYRGLLRALTKLGHEVYFLEHDKPWYSKNRDFKYSDDYHLLFYNSITELKESFEDLVKTADMVIVGSYVPEGILVSQWVLHIAEGVRAFYDIDTPLTLHKLDQGDDGYINSDLIPQFDLYLSFSGGTVLELLENRYGAQKARALYCSVDSDLYYPIDQERNWDLGYLGTYSKDRQPTVENLLNDVARELPLRNFIVGGPNYPVSVKWPINVGRIEHLPPNQHCEFYNRQRFTLNVTRKAMINLGYSPSVRLFEAAACGVPIISDYWEGLSDFFVENEEIFIARTTSDMVSILKETSEKQLQKMGEAARTKILKGHTANHRALELIAYFEEVKELAIAGNANSMDI